MRQINEKSHYATVISSLNKEYKKTKIGKLITPNDIYLLDVVYNLLQGCCLELSDIEIKKLLKIYNTLLHTSKIICNNNYQEIYQMSKKDKFIQAEKEIKNPVRFLFITKLVENSGRWLSQSTIEHTGLGSRPYRWWCCG